jgi:hypothetical protein
MLLTDLLPPAPAPQLSNMTFFTTSGSELKYGWAGASCLTQAAFMCETPAGSYPCPSPPAPPAEPEGQLTAPPAGPMGPTCE